MKKILFVCIGNYCRSPVAESIMRNISEDNFKINSAGLFPAVSSSMDPRSIKYLDENNYTQRVHIPKKITDKLIKESDYIFLMGFDVLNNSRLEKRKYIDAKLINFMNKNLDVPDPISFKSDLDYKKVMESIRICCETIYNQLLKKEL